MCVCLIIIEWQGKTKNLFNTLLIEQYIINDKYKTQVVEKLRRKTLSFVSNNNIHTCIHEYMYICIFNEFFNYPRDDWNIMEPWVEGESFWDLILFQY